VIESERERGRERVLTVSVYSVDVDLVEAEEPYRLVSHPWCTPGCTPGVPLVYPGVPWCTPAVPPGLVESL